MNNINTKPLIDNILNITNNNESDQCDKEESIKILSNISYKEPLTDILYRQIFDLTLKLKNAEEAAENYKIKYEKLKLEYDNQNICLRKFINHDQMQAILGKKVQKWSDETIQKSIVANLIGGKKLLEFSRKHLIPLCSPTTVFETTRQLMFHPGILIWNIQAFKIIVENFTEAQKHGCIKIDEKSIIPGRSRDASTGKYIGNITLPESNELACNAFAFLLTLMDIRIKLLIGFHFTGHSTDGSCIKEFLYELICIVERQCGIFIDSICMDMGPSNVSLINSMGLSLKKGSRCFSVTHPNDSSRELKVNYDPVHHIKNLSNGLRNNDVTLPSFIIQSHKLVSSIARFSEVKKLFNQQKKAIYKTAPSLKKETIEPNHFERMYECTAYNLMSNDVTAGLDFISTKFSCDTQLNERNIIPSQYEITATSWLLKFFNKYSTLMIKSKWTKDNFEENSEWLMNLAIPVLDSLKFGKTRLKCVNGAILGILSTLEMIKELLDIGYDYIDSEWLTNNAVENFFSQIVYFRQKPSALQFTHGVKALSLSKYMQDPVESKTYKWSFTNVSVCSKFLKLLKETHLESSNSEERDDETDIFIPSHISWEDVFCNKLEFNSFIIKVMEIIEIAMQKIDCDRCKAKLLTYLETTTDANILLLLKTGNNYEPSTEVQEYFVALEYAFKQLQTQNPDIDSKKFRKMFIDTILIQLDAEFEHCLKNLIVIIELFLNTRLKLELQSRHIHRRDKYASKIN